MSVTDIHTKMATTQKPAISEAKRDAMILLSVLVFLAGWGLSIFTWGVPGLYIPALALVPVMSALLILISRG